jgi:Polyketide cyclase / dehydrase and lipid transport
VGEVSAGVHVDADLAETWDHYFDPEGWAAWVDGFGAVEAASGYPEEGGTLRWRSSPAGRGEVTEKVLEHEPRRLHRISFSDPESSGELLTSFRIEGDGTAVVQEMTYTPRRMGPLGPLTDWLFVRGQVRRSLARSLARLKSEVEELIAPDG